MYGLKRLNSANHLPALFAAAAAAPYPPLGSFAFAHSSCRRAAETAGVGDLVYVGKGYKICGKDETEVAVSDGDNTYTRKELPPELRSTNVARVTCESTAVGGTCDVYLVGTRNTCKKSWLEAEAVVKILQPQVVFLELCSDRLDRLMPQNSKSGENSGGEFRLAYAEAMKYGGKVILGDRPGHISMLRIFARMSFWKLCELLITEPDMTKFPNFREIIGDERDQYMSAKILEVAREQNSVVAIVGRAHLAGIQKNWKQPVDVKQLLDTSTYTLGKILSTFGALVVYVTFWIIE